jgi:hypothetical protein
MSDLRKLLDECTVGPWEITDRKITKHGGAYDFISGFKWGKFARVVVRFDYDYADNPAGVANARLIALAPDLAAALLKAEEALDDAIRIAARNEAGPDLDAARATLTEIRKLIGAK